MKSNDILSTIIANKAFEVSFQKRSISLEDIQNRITDITPKYSMRKALEESSSGIIAEFKRRSPSKDWIKQNAEVTEIVPAYEKAGASALSILTDEDFFGGTLRDIRTVRPFVKLPIIRKDFIIDEYQLYQARIVGADAVLLIAAALQKDICRELTEKAHQLGLEVLLELHSENELDYITPEVDMIGINNRNLGSFHTSVDNSFRLAELLPKDRVLVSESGISDPETIKKLRETGFRGFLVGETFMKTESPGETLAKFIHKLNN